MQKSNVCADCFDYVSNKYSECILYNYGPKLLTPTHQDEKHFWHEMCTVLLTCCWHSNLANIEHLFP